MSFSGLSLIFSAVSWVAVSCPPRRQIYFAGRHFGTKALAVRLFQEGYTGCVEQTSSSWGAPSYVSTLDASYAAKHIRAALGSMKRCGRLDVVQIAANDASAKAVGGVAAAAAETEMLGTTRLSCSSSRRHQSFL